MLQHQIERIRQARLLQRIVLATSDHSVDDAVADIGRLCGVEVYRGSLEDVLDRFYRAAEPHSPSHVVRLTGDCPLADPQVIDAVINFAVSGGFDYGSNTVRPTYPDGLDVEVATFAALTTAWKEGVTPSDREHVMPFLHRQPERFRIGSLEVSPNLSHLRWTVDEPDDFAMVSKVYEALYPVNANFDTSDILDFLQANPKIANMNSGRERNEGYMVSLRMANEANK